ncbi:MAG: XRE family transcriptional regulator [Nitrosopumilales archaeon]|nr:MAG: XRE family transcriptional regulator [Nitrosopumilales archaeon]RPJ31542.1 MAG: XRE family transcriptional regulator [Nitrosopumilales archaeon]RPJ32814.1 MAG: XRE family transcriptional regulator [Nitrosopumilales archaeon]
MIPENNFLIILEHRNLTIEQVSRNTGLSKTTMYNFINNTYRRMRLDTLLIMCEYLEVTVDQLIGMESKDNSMDEILMIEKISKKMIKEIKNNYVRE